MPHLKTTTISTRRNMKLQSAKMNYRPMIVIKILTMAKIKVWTQALESKARTS